MYAFITEIWCVYVCVYCREASAWTVGDVELVGRLLFTLSPKQINSIPLVRTPMGETPSAFIMTITLSWVMTHSALEEIFFCWGEGARSRQGSAAPAHARTGAGEGLGGLEGEG